MNLYFFNKRRQLIVMLSWIKSSIFFILYKPDFYIKAKMCQHTPPRDP